MATIISGPQGPDVRRAASDSRPSNVIDINQHTKPNPPVALLQDRVRVIKVANPNRSDQEARAAAFRLIDSISKRRLFRADERSAFVHFIQAGLSALTAKGNFAEAKLGIEVISEAVGRV